jgi:putative addiction module component (TIGR02574 family)
MATIDISALSTEERLDLLDRLWESLASQPGALSVTLDQQQELNRRLDSLERDPAPVLTWDGVAAAIRARNQ